MVRPARRNENYKNIPLQPMKIEVLLECNLFSAVVMVIISQQDNNTKCKMAADFSEEKLRWNPKRKKFCSRLLGESKIVVGGLELPRLVLFKDWEPGGEYTVPLVLKNVLLKTQKIHFQ